MNIESTAALEDETCYSQQAKGLQAVEGVDRDAADLVVTQDAEDIYKVTVCECVKINVKVHRT